MLQNATHPKALLAFNAVTNLTQNWSFNQIPHAETPIWPSGGKQSSRTPPAAYLLPLLWVSAAKTNTTTHIKEKWLRSSLLQPPQTKCYMSRRKKQTECNKPLLSCCYKVLLPPGWALTQYMLEKLRLLHRRHLTAHSGGVGLDDRWRSLNPNHPMIHLPTFCISKLTNALYSRTSPTPQLV